MYPNLYYVFKDIFGVDIPFLKVVNSFGFFVAIAFLISSWVLVKELKRKQAAGEFTYKDTLITVGQPASIGDLLINFLLGFILGFKILGVLFVKNALNDPQGFIFSANGSWPAGLLLGLLIAVLKWWEKNKNKLAKPEQRKVRIWPSDRVGDITIIAAAGGFIGAKIFDNLENWDRFLEDPIGNLISPSGLTFYGGLIIATLSLWYYFHKKGISFIKVADSASPSLMLGYALGRVGCQVAGDGDWGIINSAYIAEANGHLSASTADQAVRSIEAYSYLYRENGLTGPVEHLSLKSFWELPDWFFAYDYPHNVNKTGVDLVNCDWGDYCKHLPLPVYPTPFYEIIVCLLLFFILWSFRKKIKITGRMFGVYLILNGLERFFIEKIRVNTKYEIFGFHPTQAELISSLLVITGVALYIYAPKLWQQKNKLAA